MNAEASTRTVQDSKVTLAQHMGVAESNLAGAVHGGVIMKLVDTAGALAAVKYCGSPVVTAAIDEMSFIEPVKLGDLVTVTASVNGVGNTSMEVGVRVETENPLTGEKAHTATAYLLYVAVDPESNEPVPVPQLVAKGLEERRRQRQAKARRKARANRRAAILEARRAEAEAARKKQEKLEARRARKAKQSAEAEPAEPAEAEPAATRAAPAEPAHWPPPARWSSARAVNEQEGGDASTSSSVALAERPAEPADEAEAGALRWRRGG